MCIPRGSTVCIKGTPSPVVAGRGDIGRHMEGAAGAGRPRPELRGRAWSQQRKALRDGLVCSRGSPQAGGGRQPEAVCCPHLVCASLRGVLGMSCPFSPTDAPRGRDNDYSFTEGESQTRRPDVGFPRLRGWGSNPGHCDPKPACDSHTVLSPQRAPS